MDYEELIDRNPVALVLCRSTFVVSLWWAVYLKFYYSLAHKHLSVDYSWVIMFLRDGVNHLRSSNNACNVLHVAVIGGFISQVVHFSGRSSAGCCEVISATALRTFRAPRWTLSFFERMCFATKFTGLRLPRAAFPRLVITAAGRRVFILHSVNIFVLGARDRFQLQICCLRTLAKIDTLRQGETPFL